MLYWLEWYVIYPACWSYGIGWSGIEVERKKCENYFYYFWGREEGQEVKGTPCWGTEAVLQPRMVYWEV